MTAEGLQNDIGTDNCFQNQKETLSFKQVETASAMSVEEIMACMRAKEQIARGEFYTESEMDKMVAEWIS